jgi:hypothetical protein
MWGDEYEGFFGPHNTCCVGLCGVWWRRFRDWVTLDDVGAVVFCFAVVAAVYWLLELWP